MTDAIQGHIKAHIGSVILQNPHWSSGFRYYIYYENSPVIFCTKQCNVIQTLSTIGPRASSLPSHNGHPMAVDQNAKHCLRLYSGFDEQNAFVAK